MIRDYFASLITAWDEFWFRPRSSNVLAIMRIFVGSMLLYTHVVWTLELETFFAVSEAAVPHDFRTMFPRINSFSWSHFDWFDSKIWLWGSHCLALITFFLFTIGCWTRLSGIMAFLFVVSYANRALGTLFGLDQINAFLTCYLAFSHCGSQYSVDAWRKRKSTDNSEQGRGGKFVANTIATRLIQIHLCIVYLFAGLGKVQGNSWWNGEAIWGTLASYEYQTLDMTWLHEWMWLVNIVTYATVAWEVSYAFLIWNRLTRPLYIVIAAFVHIGIGLCMGMMTFGLIMLYANIAFIEPCWLAKILNRSVGDSGDS